MSTNDDAYRLFADGMSDLAATAADLSAVSGVSMEDAMKALTMASTAYYIPPLSEDTFLRLTAKQWALAYLCMSVFFLLSVTGVIS